MARHFDYNDWDIEEVCNSLRERILESKKPIPPKVIKHAVSVVYRVGEKSYIYPRSGWFMLGVVPNFSTRLEAEEYLEQIPEMFKKGKNMWVDMNESETYTCENGDVVPCHYEIREYDYEEYEDGEHHTEYSNEEVKKLHEALYMIEKARIYLDVYDHCSDQWSFGDGRFSNELKEELEKFEENFTEELPDGYFDEEC